MQHRGHLSRTYHFFGRIPDEAHGTLIPDVDSALIVDTEDGGISGIDQFRVLSLLRQTSCNVLTDTDHTNDLSMLIPTGGGVKKNLNTGAGLGHEGELEVSRFLAA